VMISTRETGSILTTLLILLGIRFDFGMIVFYKLNIYVQDIKDMIK